MRSPATARQPATATVEDMASNHGLALVRQKERLVAALRPLPSGALLAPQPSALGALRPLRHPRRTSWTHGFARLDVSGRVRDAVLFDALGWRAGDALTIGLDGDHAVVRQGGTARLDARGRLTLPETVRRVLALDAGDGALLSADTDEGVLLVTPAHRCDEVVSA